MWERKKNGKNNASTRDWTEDLVITSDAHYHCAIKANDAIGANFEHNTRRRNSNWCSAHFIVGRRGFLFSRRCIFLILISDLLLRVWSGLPMTLSRHASIALVFGVYWRWLSCQDASIYISAWKWHTVCNQCRFMDPWQNLKFNAVSPRTQDT